MEYTPWYQKREFSLLVVISIICQVSVGIWYASQIVSRVDNLERSLTELAEIVKEDKEWQVEQRTRVWAKVDNLSENMNSLTGSMNGIKSDVNHISNNVNRILDNMISKKVTADGK